MTTHIMLSQQPIKTIYIAHSEYLAELCEELNHEVQIFNDMVCSPYPMENVCFAQDIWLEPKLFHFQSISEAVHQLRQAGKFWYMHPISHIRRASLIESQLRKCPNLQRHFPIESAIVTMGGFSLLDQNTLICSTQRQKAWPDGRCFYIEDKINPPNRAYLKLWETLTLLNQYPQPGDNVLDLGSSPGGWTWVLQSLGAHVTAVDKALLAPNIANQPNIRFLQQSAFALEPSDSDTIYDWVFSDIACYPSRAHALILKWQTSGKAKKLVFTIKFQGKIDLQTLDSFKSIPNARLLHLFHNKHEATFIWP